MQYSFAPPSRHTIGQLAWERVFKNPFLPTSPQAVGHQWNSLHLYQLFNWIQARKLDRVEHACSCHRVLPLNHCCHTHLPCYLLIQALTKNIAWELNYTKDQILNKMHHTFLFEKTGWLRKFDPNLDIPTYGQLCLCFHAEAFCPG